MQVMQPCTGQNLLQQVPIEYVNFLPAGSQLNQFNTLLTNPVQVPAPMTQSFTLPSCIWPFPVVSPSPAASPLPSPAVSPIPSPVLASSPEPNVFFTNPSPSASPLILPQNQSGLVENFNLNAVQSPTYLEVPPQNQNGLAANFDLNTLNPNPTAFTQVPQNQNGMMANLNINALNHIPSAFPQIPQNQNGLMANLNLNPLNHSSSAFPQVSQNGFMANLNLNAVNPNPSCFNFPQVIHQNKSGLTGNFNKSAPVQSFQNVEVQKMQVPAGCQVFFKKQIIKHHATPLKIIQRHGPQLIEGMKIELGFEVLTELKLYVTAAIESNNAMSIFWYAHPEECDLKALIAETRTKAFDERLICRLVGLQSGEFNRHLHGSKQLMIINEGFRLVHKLGHALMTFDDSLETALSISEGNQFDERSKKAILGVCKADKGKALRGPNVVGAQFRGTDVLKMMEFVETVESHIGDIKRATMIPSMKGKSQYKGWSIYIETPSVSDVQRIVHACQNCSFDKVEIFVAIDNLKK
jgi:hypothetical protein